MPSRHLVPMLPSGFALRALGREAVQHDLRKAKGSLIKCAASDARPRRQAVGAASLGVEQNAVTTAGYKLAAMSMSPSLGGVSEAEYRALNRLGPDVDIFEHYLDNSKTAQLFAPQDLNDAVSGRDMYSYGEGYTTEIVKTRSALGVAVERFHPDGTVNHGYDEAGMYLYDNL